MHAHIIEKLQVATSNEVDRLGGLDAAIDACERMYSSLFSCGEPIRLADCDDRGEIERDIKISAFLKFTGKTEEHYGEYLLDAMDSWEDSFVLDENTLIVCACNYKGEGEGYAIYTTDMPEFKGKSNSFYQVNFF